MSNETSKLHALFQAADDIDDRLAPGQTHRLVVDELGFIEPLQLAAQMMRAGLDQGTLPRATIFQGCFMLHDRINGPPDVKARKKSAEQNTFQLEFAWSTPNGEEHTAEMEYPDVEEK